MVLLKTSFDLILDWADIGRREHQGVSAQLTWKVFPDESPKRRQAAYRGEEARSVGEMAAITSYYCVWIHI